MDYTRIKADLLHVFNLKKKTIKERRQNIDTTYK